MVKLGNWVDYILKLNRYLLKMVEITYYLNEQNIKWLKLFTLTSDLNGKKYLKTNQNYDK